MTPKSFHTKMLGYLCEYQEHLLAKSKGSSISNISIVSEFLSFLCYKHLIGAIDQISVSICCSKFYADYRRGKKGTIGKEEMKEILWGYFVFVEKRYGVRNGKLMRGLEK